jgi:hypothetical protein
MQSSNLESTIISHVTPDTCDNMIGMVNTDCKYEGESVNRSQMDIKRKIYIDLIK